YPSPGFKKLFDFHVFAAAEKQGLFQSVVREEGGGLTEIHLNWRAGELYLGILDQEKAWWQWGWLSEGEGTLSPLALRAVRRLKEYGAEHEIPEMTFA